jgi:DNA mismatch repair protein MutS2
MDIKMNTTHILEFDHITQMLCDNAVSQRAKDRLKELKPYLREEELIVRMKETTEARRLIDAFGTPPLTAMKDLVQIIELVEKDGVLTPEQFTVIGQFIASCRRTKSYLKQAESSQLEIAYYGESIYSLQELGSEIEKTIRNQRIDPYATPELKNICRKIDGIQQEIKSKLESILRGNKKYFADAYIAERNGHYVLPVKKEYKHQVSGSVISASATGATYFIEPTAVAKLREKLSVLEIEESNEELKILYTLTALVADEIELLRINIDALETLDYIFAKGKLSSDLKAVEAKMNTDRRIVIEEGRHPLLQAEHCVPLNFKSDKDNQGIVITGPNTGGKTVALKTVGLLSMMAQCGLHIPCKSADIAMNNRILCDIGDGQNITENLSTFSAHITNIISILEETDEESLILLDELGSGTDPAEGMGIAIAILEELLKKKCKFIATTHYPEVKEFADKTDGIINARMAFDRESLKPLYALEIGEAGESCALYIAKRLGLPARMLERAYSEAYRQERVVEGRHIQENESAVKERMIQEDILKERIYDKSFQEEEKEIEIKAARTTEKIQKKQVKRKVNHAQSEAFQIGDCVEVLPDKQSGIIFQTVNSKGEIGVQIKKEKIMVNHKRIRLKVKAQDMYPEDYDFSIIFDTVENRKKSRQMGRKYSPDIVNIIEE